MRPGGKVLENGPAAEEASSEAEKKEPERKEPACRFPAVAPETAEFEVRLPPFPDAPEGFTGSLDRLLECLRAGALTLETLPLAPLVDQYLTFRRPGSGRGRRTHQRFSAARGRPDSPEIAAPPPTTA